MPKSTAPAAPAAPFSMDVVDRKITRTSTRTSGPNPFASVDFTKLNDGKVRNVKPTGDTKLPRLLDHLRTAVRDAGFSTKVVLLDANSKPIVARKLNDKGNEVLDMAKAVSIDFSIVPQIKRPRKPTDEVLAV